MHEILEKNGVSPKDDNASTHIRHLYLIDFGGALRVFLLGICERKVDGPLDPATGLVSMLINCLALISLKAFEGQHTQTLENHKILH